MWWFNREINYLPEHTGPLTPGCMDVMLDYKKDGLFMRLYYPTSENKNDKDNVKRWIRWSPDESYIAGLAKVLYSFTFIVKLVTWWACKDWLYNNGGIRVLYGAKPKLDQKLKCIILSHGLGGHRALYSNICCELASRGFLVAALEHRDGSACYTYYYNSKESASKNLRTVVSYEQFALGKKNHFNQRSSQVIKRAQESKQAVDFIMKLNNGEVPHNVIDDLETKHEFKLEDLREKIDVETLTMMGHSFGGATSLLTLSETPELKQGVLLDPWMFPIKGQNLHEKVKQPLLFINTQTFHIAANVEALSKFLTSDNERIMKTILHTTHEFQTDTTLLIGSWLNWFMKKVDPLVALKINNAMILEFLSKKVNIYTTIEDSQQYLEDQKDNFDVGLTKPWA